MTDYAEEQRNEIEALEAIYPEIEILETQPFHKFQLELKSQDAEDDPEHAATATILFTYVENYPDVAPVMEVAESENLSEEQVDVLLRVMNEQAEENVGMVMVFTIVSAVQEKLSDLVEESKTQKQLEEERRIKAEEEAEQKRFEGTRVTIETFLAWKMKFDAEMAEKDRLLGITETTSKKLTGKELFQRDATLNESDVKFLQEEGEAVEVDESLFQDLDDLELADEDLEDG
ncbi:RWD domain-containing protein 1-like [Liolophura sinensis]|uniref:RWD domain-containing protein 1-like n=1 Tax=Liolophura sinensis TaxID=3198878 RepID=UPI003158D3E3